MGDAPPSYNNSLRRGMSMESITAPPSQLHQYMQPENQERVIERQLNITHQPTLPTGGSEPPQAMPIDHSVPTTAPDSMNSITNITSASLANLAKGVEQNISEMSQKMSQGGPFGDMQNNANTNALEANPEPATNPPPPSSMPGAHPQQPSVNNTFVNTHMSIGQVNIQNVTANQSYQGPGGVHMQQNVDVSMNNFPPGPGMPQPDPMYKPPQPAAPAVSIQNKGRNTIQYLPVSQPAIAPTHEPVVPPKHNFDFMSSARFSSPTPPNFLPGENPSMAMAAGGHNPRHPAGAYLEPMHHAAPPHGKIPIRIKMYPNLSENRTRNPTGKRRILIQYLYENNYSLPPRRLLEVLGVK